MYLYAMTALAHAQNDVKTLHCILQADFRTALRSAQPCAEGRAAERSSDHARRMHQATWCGDLMLAQGYDEDAEANHRRAVRAASGCERGQARVASLRNAAFMSLHRRHYGAAVAALECVAADPASSDATRTEALCALAAAQHSMGEVPRSRGTLAIAVDQARKAGSDELVMLTDTWSMELAALQAVRAHAALSDHIYWRSPVTNSTFDLPHERLLPALEACLSRHLAVPLLAQRLRHLRDLLRASRGDAAAFSESGPHLAWLARAGLVTVERQARLDWALVALSRRQVEAARALIEPLGGANAVHAGGQWDLDLSYCRAKVCDLEGNVEHSMLRYARYAREALTCVRSECQVPQASHAPRPEASVTTTSAAAARDELESSLPARYRRAYRYMIEHMADHSLDMQEVADQAGATKRALQAAFRLHLGMTPAEVLRRRRMERIRSELVAGNASSKRVNEVAARWGIRNRSTLLAGYRRHFNESPEQSVARSAVPSAGVRDH
jgi:AraC-like DNA-binding protein